MKPTSPPRLFTCLIVANIALLGLASPSRAQLAPAGTPGDRVVYTFDFGPDLAGGLGNSVTHDFDFAALADSHDSFDLGANGGVDDTKVFLTEGHHVVIYGLEYTSSANARGAVDTFLQVNGLEIPFGASAGYLRDSGTNDLFSRGGTILEVAQGDYLELASARTDNHSGTLNHQTADLQLIKLDDTLDFVRLSVAFNTPLLDASQAGPQPVVYDVQDELDPGSFAHDTLSNPHQITLKDTGRYLVFANTGCRVAGGNSHRNVITQELYLTTGAGTNRVADSATTVYVRHAGSGDAAGGLIDLGSASLGMILETSQAGSVLEVRIERDNDVGSTNTTVAVEAARTGLTIVKLPAYGEYIGLSGGPQDVNTSGGVPLDFSASADVSNGSFTYDSGASASQIVVNQSGDYLFLASNYVRDFPNGASIRALPRLSFDATPAGGFPDPVLYGQGGAYLRDDNAGGDRARDAGDWAGAILSLGAGDAVETIAQQYGDPGVVTADSVGFQALNISSISTPPLNPVVGLSGPLNVLASSVGTTITDEAHLLTSDANSSPAELIYTITSSITGGTLRLNGAALALNGTFTQDDVNNDRLTFDAAATVQSGGFDFSVSDGGANPDSGTFTVQVGIATLLADDSGATNEDAVLTLVDPAGAVASLLVNDTGTSLTVAGFDATSSQGAAVSVAADGTFSYDPTASPALQALAVGEQAADSFTYTVTDFLGSAAVATVNILVDGVNDAPTVVSESFASVNGVGAKTNLLANDSDSDASDRLTVSNLTQQVFGNGGAVPTDVFNFEAVPLVFTSQFGATVRISADGTFDYDVSTSAVLLGLAPGVSISETFDYDVFDGNATESTTVTINSTGADLPTNDYANTDAGSTINIAILGNDFVRNNPASVGTPTPGAPFDLNAADPSNSDATWNNSNVASGGAVTMDGAGAESVRITAIANAPPGITAAYDLSGTNSGGPLGDTDTPAAANFLYGSNFSTSSYTIEAVIRPDDHAGDEPIWGSGGNGTGSSLILIDDQLIFTIGNGSFVAQALGTIPPNALAGGDYVHVVGTFDIAADVASLYINNALVDQGSGLNITTGAPGNLTDWSGTDNEGIGRSAGTTGGDVNVAPFLGSFGTTDIPDFNDANDRFDGEIAIVRVYNGVLTPAEISANFDAVFGTSAPATPADLTGLAGGAPSIGVPVNLPSGATVTLLANGTVDYNPNGAFGKLGQGLTARDSFTYSLNTNSNATVTVNVEIAGTNTDPQITLASTLPGVAEGSPATFTISSSAAVSGPVNVTLRFSGLAGRPADFSGSTTVQIPNGARSAPLTLSTINDSLFEGLENIVVTIDSVSGNAVMGGILAAEVLVTDVQSAPLFAILSEQGSAAEGTAASFTIAASVASQQDRTFAVSYSGTALNGRDYFGLSTVTLPAGRFTSELNIILFDDGVAEGTESLTVTLDSVDTGTIDTPRSASTDVTDGAGKCLFLADFENINPLDTPGGFLTGTDAPFAANLGTPIGSWEDVPVANVSGDLPGVYFEIDDVKGDGLDSALVLDRPAVGTGDITARLLAPVDVSGSNTAVIWMDLGNRRTQNNSEAKSWRIIGLDSVGEKSFELYVSGNNNAPHNEQLHHVDSAGVLTPLGQAADFDNTGSIEEESEQSQLVLSLSSGGYQVGIDRWPMDGVIDVITDVLDYAGPATQVSGILFSLATSFDDTMSSGIIIDDVKAAGTAGNVGPTATLGGVAIANGGSSVLPDQRIGTGTVLNTLRVNDIDAGNGTVTAAFESRGVAPLTFTGSGPASVIGNGTGTLILSGTLSNVNASLAAGVTVNTNAVTGGDATITFTIDDGGNTGLGGAKSLSHDLTFFVNEGPTVTIDLAAGQAKATSSSPIEFQVVFSEAVTGFNGSDVDLSASTETGPLVAGVSGAGASYLVSVTGMSSGGKVIISVPKGAANAAVGGAATEASKAIDDTVTFIPHLPPSATNLVQVINYTAGPVDLGDIRVSDPNDSVITTTQAPQYDYPALHGDALTLTPDPGTDAGFAIELAFEMSGFDDFGTVRVMEIGGTSNGSGIYLIDGIAYLVSKMNSAPASVPSGLEDTDWSDGNISVPLTTVPLPLDVPARLAVVSSLDSVTFSVNGMGQTTVPLTGRVPATQNNWSGDDTIRVGQNPDGGRGGLGTDPFGVFDDVASFPMEGTVSLARLWHAADASGFSILAVSSPEEITATLSLLPGEGDLTEPAGAVYDPGTGIWTITGTLSEVNGALAAVQFLPKGTSPVSIEVTIDDGDEDGSGPLLGMIILTTGGVQDSDGDGIADDYELANGLNPNDPADARSDRDLDGWDALSEYLMGTAASIRAEVPLFEIDHVNATRVEIRYGPILAGRTYEVLASSTGEPLPPAIDSFTAPADAASNTAIDTTGGQTSEIYRLRVTLPIP